MGKKVILLGLNEINFEFVERYISLGYLPNFQKLIAKHGYKKTISEDKYELLEPWIQWVSIHTGKMYAEHQVYRLGDIVQRPDLKQLWEIAEAKGLSVGAVSPFNAANNLQTPAFFIPDPWTKTHASGSKLVVDLSNAVSDAVNNNANNKLSKSALLALLKGFIRFVPARSYMRYASLILMKLKAKSTKSAILDNLLSDIFVTLWKSRKPDFSSLFLNSGAHVQHHYMFNSKVYNGDQKNPDWYCPAQQDPVLDILSYYDMLIGKLMKLDCRLFVATGLHQNPHLETTFYWRIKDHQSFLNLIGVKTYDEVIPRMSRDFLINCRDEVSANAAVEILESVMLNGEKVFSIDNRGNSLFIELIYDKEIPKNSFISVNNEKTNIDLSGYISFVAIKNGEHDGIGYFIDTNKTYSKEDSISLSAVFPEIVKALDEVKK
jgi:hypothetical protein